MSYVELKPILFSNFIQRLSFLKANKLDNILYQKKNMVVLKYNVEQYKSFFNDHVRESMCKHNASFFVLSSRQFAYMTHKLLAVGFCLLDIKVVSTLNNEKLTPDEFIDDDYEQFTLNELNSFFESLNPKRISDVTLHRHGEQVSIKVNGVLTFSNISNPEIDDILKGMREAYDDSQK